ncbi:hypothetical protein [Actinokineospora xionganensis]|uniref:hypothetical protein n=1 Tax=Actinokineospora xionganensis TaxID=2684470 RepID=UPI001C9C9233|nr:hypothetical protein [Actinokineospora xionganensis]
MLFTTGDSEAVVPNLFALEHATMKQFHHGVDPERFPSGDGSGGHLLFSAG